MRIMNLNNLNEQDLYRFFEHDSKNAKPDQSIKTRLLYLFQVKSNSYRIRQNSFSGMFTWLFNFNNLTVKAALASLIIVFSVINFRDNSPVAGQSFIDSTASNNQLYLDSAMLLPFNSDTCFLKL